jgi:aspartyl-tRNA(Asn)/glutamyl-tRNA(Gln) amidotransferase subunit A
MNIKPSPEETLAGASHRIRSRGRTCRDVLEACLARIDEHESRIRAWVSVDRVGALRRAAELDAELAAGHWRGPLHGVPVGIKDIVDVAGWPTAAGAEWFAAEWAALSQDRTESPHPGLLAGGEREERAVRHDAPVVARLREAGAVIVGKTVTTQFASFDPPVTCNPWHHDRTPGGSSSGSAAAVATGMCLGAIGSQTGGSITRPASYCGVAGCKPTFGLVSCEGIVPLAPNMDHPGPIARTVRDLALLLDVIADDRPNALGAAATLDAEPLAPPRLGRLGGMFDALADDEVRSSFANTLDRLSRAGASVPTVALPASFAEVNARHRTIMAVEAAAWHQDLRARHPDGYLPKIRSLLEEGFRTPAPEYVRCCEHQARLSREMLGCFEHADVLVTPATTTPAPDTSSTGDPSFNSPWSYTGLPTVSFPVGLSRDGLPLAIQFVGSPNSEPALFRAAAWCEQVLHAD